MKNNRFKKIPISLLVFGYWMFSFILSSFATPGDITTVAGGGVSDDGKATEARLNYPYGVFVDTLGNLFIADSANSLIRRVDGETGIITTVAGTGEGSFSGDGGKATEARLVAPRGVFVDAFGNLFIADFGNNRIRRVEGIAAPTILKVGVFAP